MNESRKQFLRQLKAYGLEHDVPNISWETAEFLHEKIKEKNPKTVLEIGTANGFSTIWIADAVEECENSGMGECGNIVTIERSAPSFIESIENFKQAEVADTITSLYGDAKVILEAWGGDLKVIDSVEEVPKRPQYLETNGLVYGACSLPEQFDLVFIDAQKIHYDTFWNLVQPLLDSDAWVIVDDVLKFGKKTKSFTDLIQSQDEWKYKVFQTDSDDGVMVLKRD